MRKVLWDKEEEAEEEEEEEDKEEEEEDHDEDEDQNSSTLVFEAWAFASALYAILFAWNLVRKVGTNNLYRSVIGGFLSIANIGNKQKLLREYRMASR